MKGQGMKRRVAVTILTLLALAAGCVQTQEVRVTYISDPPGGTLYTLYGKLWGPCPKVLYYSTDDEEDIARGYLDAEGLMVRWPSGPDGKSDVILRITLDGTDQTVTFVQPEYRSTDAEPQQPQQPQQTVVVTGKQNETASIGTVMISSNVQGADVYIDGVFVGNTPAYLKLRYGIHIVEAKKKGYSDYRKELRVYGSSGLYLRAELEKQ